MRRDRFPAPARRSLRVNTTARVRFQEVDALGVVWHGHYLSYFEDGRNAFGRRFGFGYESLLRAGFVAPLVHVELDFHQPAGFNDELSITTRLHPDEAARIDFTYAIADPDGQTLVTGRSVQVFAHSDGSLVLTMPEFFRNFLARWSDEMEET